MIFWHIRQVYAADLLLRDKCESRDSTEHFIADTRRK
jgi:hypothetical protein